VVKSISAWSRDDDGLDDPVALPPEEFARMVRAIRDVERLGRDRAVEDLAAEYGGSRVDAVLGDGIKRLAPAERANYERTNRSLHAVRLIGAGETIGADDIAVLRTEKVLRSGLAPATRPRLSAVRPGGYPRWRESLEDV
jgi:sialic acid synthase SpsE